MTDLDMVPSKESHRSKPKTASKVSLTYNPGRVKSSIPKLVVVPQPKKDIPSEQSQAKFMEELQVKEIERSIKIQRDEEVAAEVVRKLRDNPNESIHQM
jgi:S-adenosylmethionine synthetase